MVTKGGSGGWVKKQGSRKLKVERVKNPMQTDVAMLILDKADFKTKNIIRDKMIISE